MITLTRINSTYFQPYSTELRRNELDAFDFLGIDSIDEEKALNLRRLLSQHMRETIDKLDRSVAMILEKFESKNISKVFKRKKIVLYIL